MTDTADDAFVFSLTRPSPTLLRYYGLAALLWGPLFFVPLIYQFLRYRTIRYQFDAEGVTMRWGGLERREVSLTYARIQDIHVSANVLERWLGLARLEIQTASGDAKAEMTLEGLPQPLVVRDFLYNRSRGARASAPRPAAAPEADLAQILRDVAAEMRALRQALEQPNSAPPEQAQG